MIIKKNGNQLTKTFTDNDSATPSLIAVDNESRRRSEASRIYNVTFNGIVSTFDAVYWNSANQNYDRALADGSPAQKVIGIADTNKLEVIMFGIVEDFPGFVEGDVLYLSTTNPGELTTNAPADAPIKMGEIVFDPAKGKLILLVDIDNYINAVNADLLDGRHAGTVSGQIAVNTGTLNTNLNADMVDGKDATSTNVINTIPVRDGSGIIYASRFDSDAATGTSPFIIDSTTVVPNLNVDMVDGHHLDQNVNTTSIPRFSHLMIDSTAVVENLNAEMVDGYHLDQDVRSTASPHFNTITLDSTAPISNLNADKVDGYHSSQTAAANTIPVSRASNGIHPDFIPPINQPFGIVTNTGTYVQISGLNTVADVGYLIYFYIKCYHVSTSPVISIIFNGLSAPTNYYYSLNGSAFSNTNYMDTVSNMYGWIEGWLKVKHDMGATSRGCIFGQWFNRGLTGGSLSPRNNYILIDDAGAASNIMGIDFVSNVAGGIYNASLKAFKLKGTYSI